MTKKDPRNIQIRKTLKYIWRFYSPYKFLFFSTHFLISAAILIGFFIAPLFLKDFFDLITEYSGENRTEILPQIQEIIWKLLILYIFAFWILSRLSEVLLCHLVAKSMKHAEVFAFSKILEHSPEFFANNFVGSIVSKFGRFIRSTDQFNHLLYFNFAPNFLRFFAAVGMIFYFIPKIAIGLFLWGIIFLSIILWGVRKWRLPSDLKSAAIDSKIGGINADAFSNILPIKMFTRQSFENRFFGNIVTKAQSIRLKNWLLWVKMNAFQSVMITGLEIWVMIVLSEMWVNHEISVGTIILIQTFLIQIYANLWNFGQNIKDFFRTLADTDEMIEILETPIGISDSKNPEKCKISKGRIEFKNVNFQYNKDIDIFKNFNLNIKPGERIGLVGESGAGKSTFVNLLLRFSDLNDGRLSIDGQDISKITQNDLRRNIAYVPQEPVLFHRTLFENIKYGDINATKKEIHQAAKKAHALEFIQRTPEKWNTFVGERGVKLSGGEKQRVAIARAMLKKAPILILDEATSALDSKAEKLIQKALKTLMHDRTTIVIAHRLSTLREMDRIIVLDNGKIIEEGTHDELVKNKGKYAELWGHQVGGFIG